MKHAGAPDPMRAEFRSLSSAEVRRGTPLQMFGCSCSTALALEFGCASPPPLGFRTPTVSTRFGIVGSTPCVAASALGVPPSRGSPMETLPPRAEMKTGTPVPQRDRGGGLGFRDPVCASCGHLLTNPVHSPSGCSCSKGFLRANEHHAKGESVHQPWLGLGKVKGGETHPHHGTGDAGWAPIFEVSRHKVSHRYKEEKGATMLPKGCGGECR